MSGSNCCFLTSIQISQEAGQAACYSHFLKNFPQFFVIHMIKGFDVINKAEVDVFLELSCFFDDPADAGNLISGSSGFSKSSLNIWKFTVHVLLKPDLVNFEYYFASVCDECNCAVVWTSYLAGAEGSGQSPRCQEGEPLRISGSRAGSGAGTLDVEDSPSPRISLSLSQSMSSPPAWTLVTRHQFSLPLGVRFLEKPISISADPVTKSPPTRQTLLLPCPRGWELWGCEPSSCCSRGSWSWPRPNSGQNPNLCKVFIYGNVKRQRAGLENWKL